MAVRSGDRLIWSLLVVSIGWQLDAAPARANGAFPESQNIMTPESLPNEILLGTNFGLVLSFDGGRTWSWTCEQTQNSYAILYQLGPPPRNRLFATSLAGLIFSDDASCSWSVAGGAAAGTAAVDLFPDPTNAERILAVVAVAVDAGIVSRVLQSMDGGATFGAKPLYIAASGDNISGVEISRSMPATIYLTLTSGTAHTPKLAQSTNGGATWQVHDLSAQLPAGTNFIRLIAIDPDDPQKVFLRIRSLGDGGSSEGLAVTDDGGATATTPLTLPGGILSAFTRMASGAIVLGGVVGTTNVAYTSTDGGSSFRAVPTPQPSFRGLSSRGTTLYVVADNRPEGDGYAIGTSTDLGMTWTPLMAYEDIQSIQACLMSTCQSDCLGRAIAGQWSADVCSATAVDAGTDAGTDTGLDGAADATVTPVGAKPTGGCRCAMSGSPPSPGWRVAGIGLTLMVVFRRRRSSR